MKRFATKHLSLMLALLASAASLQANSCMDECRSCPDTPLEECAYSVQIQAGVNPIIWAGRCCTYGVANVDAVGCDDNFLSLRELPRFHKLFRTPWIVGGKLGWNMSACDELYLEFDYTQAKARSYTLCIPSLDDCTVGVGLDLGNSKYEAYMAYVGARHYFERCWCDRLTFFLGGKVGLLHHKAIRANLSATGECALGNCNSSCNVSCNNSCNVSCNNSCDFSCNGFSGCNDLFKKNTVISAGGNIGLDFCFWGDFDFVITAEVVGSGPLQSCSSVVVGDFDEAGISNIVLGRYSTEVSFPVTFGFKYTF